MCDGAKLHKNLQLCFFIGGVFFFISLLPFVCNEGKGKKRLKWSGKIANSNDGAQFPISGEMVTVRIDKHCCTSSADKSITL